VQGAAGQLRQGGVLVGGDERGGEAGRGGPGAGGGDDGAAGGGEGDLPRARGLAGAAAFSGGGGGRGGGDHALLPFVGLRGCRVGAEVINDYGGLRFTDLLCFRIDPGEVGLETKECAA
jgi:hypothetical protein